MIIYSYTYHFTKPKTPWYKNLTPPSHIVWQSGMAEFSIPFPPHIYLGVFFYRIFIKSGPEGGLKNCFLWGIEKEFCHNVFLNYYNFFMPVSYFSDDGSPPVMQSIDGFLNFSSIRREHSGWYKCTATHLLGEFSSIGYYLNVRGKYLIQSFMTIPINSSTDMTCLQNQIQHKKIISLCRIS